MIKDIAFIGLCSHREGDFGMIVIRILAAGIANSLWRGLTPKQLVIHPKSAIRNTFGYKHVNFFLSR